MRSIYFGSLRRVNLKQLVTVISAAIIFSVLLILPNKTFATHAAGSDLTYRFISSSGNSSVYEVTVNFYRDCQGVAAPTNISLNIQSTSCGRNFNVTLDKIAGTGQEITFPCATAKTYCSGGTNPGIQLYTYRGNVTLPVKCTDWVFSYSVCCRNCSINTITNQSNCTNGNTGNALYIEAKLNNVNGVNHSSPTFTNIPVAFVCANQSLTFNHGVVDPDGHDLVFSFITPKRSATVNVGWLSGYSATNWILSSPQVAINSTTGDITMTPTSVGQVAVCAVLVEEYDNGVLIGSVMRDMQFWVRNCGSNSLPTATGINGTSNYSTTVCAGTPVSFTVNSSDPDAGQTVTMTSNIASAGIPGATFNITNNPGSSPNFPQGTFNWTPTLGDARNSPYVFTVRVQDDACPQNGFQVFSYSIFVPNHTLSFNTSSYNGYNISCNGGNDGAASVDVTGGNSPYTYKWSNGATTQGISNLTAGTYSVTVIDADGCSNTTSVNSVVITEPPALTVSVTNPVQASCFGSSDGTALASPSGGVAPYTYLWSNSQINATATGLTGGQTYTVTVTDNNGCIKTGSVLIGQPAVLSTIITAFSNVSCNGQTTGSINLFVSGGTPIYTYQWSNGESSEDISGLAAGTYTVTVTDAQGCSTTQSQVISQPGTIVPLISSTSINGVNIPCFGESTGTASVSVTGGTTPYTYLWSNGDTEASISNLPAGPVSVTVTDANGCEGFGGPFTLTQPSAALNVTIDSISTYAGGFNVSCNGQSDGGIFITVTGGTTPYSYFWSNAETTKDITGLSAGTYTVTVVDFNGCTQSADAVITPPAPFNVTLTSPTFPGGTNIGCQGENSGSATANPSGGASPYTYLWNNTETTQTITGLYAGTYSVSVTDANGCTGEGTAVLTEPGVFVPLITGVVVNGGNNILCYGGADASAIASATGGSAPYTYVWSNGQIGATATGLTAGVVSVTVTDINNCSKSTSFTVTEPDELIPSVSVDVFNGGYNVGCNGGNNGAIDLTVQGGVSPYTYSWDNSETTEDISGLGAGTYNVIVTDANGCTATAQGILTEPDPIAAVSTSPLNAGGFNVSCNGASDGTVDLTVTGGAAPYTYSWDNGETTEDLSGLSGGTYSVTVTDANSCTTTSSVVLIEPDALGTVTVSPTFTGGNNISCNGLFDGSIDLTVTGGSTPYTFLWSNGITTEDNPNLGAGTYGVTVTDANGCTSSSSITLTEPDPVNPSATLSSYNGNNIACNGSATGTISINVTGGASPYSYVWTNINDATTQTVTGLTAGTYEVVVTDANGCVGTYTATLTEPDSLKSESLSPTFAGGFNISCNGNGTGSIDLTVTGGTLPYTYSWDNGETTEDLTNLGAGTYNVTVTDANSCTNVVATTLTEPDELSPVAVSPTYNGNNISCNGNTDGSIDLTVTGGATPYTYSWDNGETTEDLSNLGAGTYNVTVTDANGCTATASGTLTEPAVLTAPTVESTYNGGYNISCNGSTTGTIDLTPTGGTAPYTYSWDNGETTEDLSNLGAGTYNVTVTDANGCTASTSVELTEPAPVGNTLASPTFNGGYNVTCLGNNGGIDLTVTGGATPYTYSWDNGETTEDLTNLGAGTYNVTVTDANGCTSTGNIELIQSPPTNINATLSAYNGNNISCNGNTDGSIDLTVTGGATPYTYSWDNGETTEDLSNLGAGTYNVTVTDANGCTATASGTLTEPAVLTAPTVESSYNGGYNISCNGSTTGTIDLTPTGGTAPYTYSWDNGETTEDLTNLGAGTYNVTVTDANGCTVPASVELTEPDPVDNTLNSPTFAGNYNVTCLGNNGSIDLTVTGGATPYTYSWDNGETTEDLTNLGAGTYNVTVTDANGCTSTGNIELIQSPPTNINATLSAYNGNNISCNGRTDGSIDLTVTGGASPYTYSWDNGETTEDLSNLGAGTYNVTVTDANGCTATASATLTEPQLLTAPTVESSYNGGYNIACNGSTTGSIDLTPAGGTAPYTYSWDNGETTEDLTNLGAGTYNVIVTDANGCTASASVELTQPDSVKLVPVSPTFAGGDNVTCLGNDGSVTLTVTGGATSYTYMWSNGATTSDITGLSAGTYSVTVVDANGCSETASITLTQTGDLSVTLNAPTYNGENEISCNGNADGSISTNVTGGAAPYTYSWSNGETTEGISGLAAGTYTLTVTDANNCAQFKSIVLTQPELLSAANIVPSDVLCFGEANGSADITVTGGSTPYTYSWSNGETTEDISGLTIGTYSVTVTDAVGCSAAGSVVINQPELLTASVDTYTDTLGCNSAGTGAISISASEGTSPYTYSWSNGSTDQNISGLNAGTYSVTVTDANGCTAELTSSVVIVQTGIVQISSDPTDVTGCFANTNGAIDLTISDGQPPYTYTWSNGEITQDITGLAAGTYSVTVDDVNGCSNTTSVTINEPPQLTANISPSSTDVSCNGAADGSVSLSVGGGTSPYTYNWAGGETTESISGLAPGTYEVTVTDANGCTANTSRQITEPDQLTATVDTYTDTLGCAAAGTGYINIDVQGGTTAYQYAWSNGATTQNISGLSAGTFNVTVTDAHGCSATLDAALTVVVTGVVTIDKTVTDIAACFGDSTGAIELTVSDGQSPYTYTWDNGETTQSISGLAAGVYAVTVDDVNGCSNSTTITVQEPPKLTAAVGEGSVDVSCRDAADGQISLNVSGGTSPYSYNWSNGETGASLSGLEPGSYDVTVTDANGCTATTSREITEPEALVIQLVNYTDTLGCNASGQGSIEIAVSGGTEGYAYQWSNGATTQNLSGLGAGTYNVTVTDAHNCKETLPADLVIVQTDKPQLSASATDITGCFGDSTGSVELTVTDGQSPYTYTWSNGADMKDISGLKAGNYTVTVVDVNGCSAITSATVNEPSKLQVFISESTQNVSCKGAADGQISLEVSGGTPSYFYNWSNGEAGASLAGLAPGTYDVTVSDANGCTATTSREITEPDSLKVTTVSYTDTIRCGKGNTGSIDIDVTGGTQGYAYHWSNGQSAQDLSGINGGTYSVTVTDANGCSETVSYVIVQLQPVAVSLTAMPVSGCHGDSTGSITSDVTGGDGNYTYHWSNNATTESLTGLKAGEYSLTVTDASGCSGTSFVTVSEPGLLQLSFAPASPGCNNGNDGSVQLSVSGGTPDFTYLWSTGATTQNLTGLSSKVYSVTVTDVNGCTKVDSTTVINPLKVEATANVISTPCGNENTGSITVAVEGGTAPYTYNWSKGSSTTETAAGLEPGTYSITVTDAHGCSDTASAVMISMSVNLQATSPSCHGAANGSIDLTVTGGIQPFTFIWSTGATTEDISGLKAGSDTVLVLDSKGCVIRGATFVTDPQIPQFSAGGDQDVCSGNAALSASLPEGYQGFWTKISGTGDIKDKNSPQTTVTGVTIGMESYSWTISNGICTFADTVTLIVGTIEADAGSDMSVCDTVNLQLSAYTDEGTYGSWSSNNKSVKFDNPEDPNTIVHLDNRGRYKLFWTIQNQLGCISRDSIVVTFKSKAECDTLDLDMPTGFSPNFDGFNDYFVIHGILRYPENELRVYNRWGNLVYKAENYHNEWRGQNLDDRPLPDGTYFVILKTKMPEEKTLTGYVDLRR